jgi:hypothetical protein
MTTLFQELIADRPVLDADQTARLHALNLCPWGNGHTVDTDPSKQGWRFRPVKGRPDLLMIGQPGQDGCATLRELQTFHGLVYDVAIYVEKPGEVAQGMRDNRTDFDCRYVEIGTTAGFGLRVIREIAEERRVHIQVAS